MSSARRCSRTACGRSAGCTLTYVYADQTVVLGPLALHAEPHAYDLCREHADRLSAPRGWEVVRLPIDTVDPGPSNDDLLALADAVREAGRPLIERAPERPAAGDLDQAALDDPSRGLRRGHLRVLSSEVPR